MYKKFWWRNLKRNGHLENRGVNGSVIIKFIVKKYAETGLD
jgi:hypothetical protein